MHTNLKRRKILSGAPALLAGMAAANTLPSIASASASVAPGGTSADRTRITYFQVPMQKRWPINEKLVKDKPYAKYFTKDLVAPVDMVNALASGPLPPEHVLPPTVAGLAKMMQTFADAPVSGYAFIDEGPLAYAQSRHVFPGVTAKMFEWWFTWHPIESERYMLWFPHAHIHNSVVDPVRLANDKLTYSERLYGNPNHVTEYIGPLLLDSYINFDTPESFGVDPAALKANGFTFNASGIITPVTDRHSPLVFMIHLGRDTPAGLEMINRYWIGSHASFGRFKKFPDGARLSQELVRKMKLDKVMLENLAYEMAVHDMTEFTCLGKFLPALYQEYGA
ncbi:TPA: hypothetical protein QDC20_003084 [Burkholderia aenigmatica]|uniref:DAPG hydrolase family protein n=1 Tax=Burkholderia sp. AU45251 TaxID=3059204 RepID=UPI0026526A68|nr:hypothetical protein [Burkholderia sp. AU45251]HDR9481987.1 hypothetical protein [Burkholderia aenigmatica]MDN7515381.1 hypothetical protein [Burkholderia sp. AU45251]HDR9515454.1 hypothetical protein [Burkholderia aenigmatica]HDR9590358.1 hypothetical protein [Burkholderia aenigmatica]HDR9598731.1 hypothetical protein [Burkholderia aenigmatica]